MTFYMTFNRRETDETVAWAEENDVPMMTSANRRWSWATDSFKEPFEYDTRRAFDSGGFNVQSRWVRDRLPENPPKLTAEHVSRAGSPERLSDPPFYPWSIQEYHEWLSGHQDSFEWAAVMDYACEEVFDPLYPLGEKIEQTITNTIEQFNLDPDYELVPVLQGRTFEDYLHSYDALVSHGIPVEKVGLGTVCRISSSSSIVELERKIRKYMPEIEHIHAFGVKIESFKLGASFESADSAAWVYPAARGRSYVSGGNGMVEVDASEVDNPTFESFRSYYEYASSLHKTAISD